MTVMMFNSVEDARAASDTSQQEASNGMMPEFYEMQENVADVSQPMEVVQSSYETSNAGGVSVDTTASTVNGENVTFVNEGNVCATEAADQNNMKAIDIPEILNISVLESDPPNTEPPQAEESLNENEKLAYQLWECPTCTALFREKDQCEQHISKSHDFTCGLCCEPFHDKEAFEVHVICHVNDVPKYKPQVSHQVYEYSEADNFEKEKQKSTLVCSTCDWTFSSSVDLQKHKECHVDE